jgi:transcriptional regulator with XRE-family HTH domain
MAKDGKYLLQVRNRLDLSQVAFGERLGYDRRTVLRWENGQEPIPPAIILAAQFLELGTLTRAEQLKRLRRL